MQVWDECQDTNLAPDIKGRIIREKAQLSRFVIIFGIQLWERIQIILVKHCKLNHYQQEKLSKLLIHNSKG